jgi:CDP-glycerol glycerophosphotransferase (TagB/SpsB family)
VSNDFLNYKKKEKNVKYVGLFTGVFYFLTSKYFFYCFGKYPIFPSKQQEVVNLLHGMPLKRIGNLQQGNEKNNYNFFTKIVVYSEFFNDVIKKSFKATDVQIIKSFSPRMDYLLKPSNPWRSTSDKCIFWMPTYRENGESPFKIHGEKIDFEKLQMILQINNVKLLIKPHPLDKSNFTIKRYPNIVIITDHLLSNKNIKLYELLGDVDGLITDYSSVAVDYLFLDRPIAYIIEDQDEYEQSRGFNFKIKDFVAGIVLTSFEDLLKYVQNLANEYDDSVLLRREVSKKMLGEKNKIASSKYILNYVGINNE